MQLSRMELVNYRNFPEVTINFTEKTLIMGPNDVGKTNLLQAMRLLLDPHMSPVQLEPADEDFCIHTGADSFEVWAFFEDVTEECLVSVFGKHMADPTSMCLGYVASRDRRGGRKEYKLMCGQDRTTAAELQSRSYLKVLNVKWVGANRDISQLLSRERRKLLEVFEAQRNEDEIKGDTKQLDRIKKGMEVSQRRIGKVSYITNAQNSLNEELNQLSNRFDNQRVEFSFQAPDTGSMLDTLELTSRLNDRHVVLGGDGTKNQVFVSLWRSTHHQDDPEPSEVSMFFFEEPEAHLHPHQQRRLAEYLRSMDAQVFITTHSPQIAAEFDPNCIVRFYSTGEGTDVASMGAGPTLGAAIERLEFRLNVLPAEAYFSDCVLLVEGVSEALLYRALAAAIDIPLDRLNISVLSVEGVGFDRYTELFGRLGVPWVLRTDNDVYQTPKKTTFHAAGLRRAIMAWKQDPGRLNSEKPEPPLADERYYTALHDQMIGIEPDKVEEAQDEVNRERTALESIGIFMAIRDLEIDLYRSSEDVAASLDKHFNTTGEVDSVAAMKSAKGTFMYHWVKGNHALLTDLSLDDLARPLWACKEICGG